MFCNGRFLDMADFYGHVSNDTILYLSSSFFVFLSEIVLKIRAVRFVSRLFLPKKRLARI
ncbi:hypothetical protein LEP1GSC103_1854 [Leptospira borgpetersenii serovar Javanica str. UI 09931]|uniref:Uncharacterized protein n=7 Tax=Leptospira borgpetersenii TaxID=174 RepID=M3H2B3_LEPBO|nr:hypothetical protein LBBP_02565 [Leptospira borgpetersenii serovar Ballum]EKP13606.1 hypothetical protein LEP1GSC128_2502 [Leptospira borgpetersenii str. 200801926]EKQ92828.1 hypothetical protein LEP1GSC101_4061 [Leptospira borgpetersenii str. UI 09149]EKR01260.1 hypothetical protein LEP1GSC121_2850 [Leptospira borgpetersenii serovar Castellonis str. 200801910]EMG01234.1 hypothetical protein LEP1GSC123_0722 [Leptospira borgpetersenii str. 200701203]EMN56989.1 hypothetical protein LEP1GSC090